MDINNRIQSYMKQRKQQRRRLPFHAVLSVLVTICVISNLIMPAISMSIENTLSSIASVETQKTTAPAAVNGMLDISSAQSWNAFMAQGDNTFYFMEVNNGQVAAESHNDGLELTIGESVELSVGIGYKFTSNVKSFLTAAGAGPHLAWDMGNTAITATSGQTLTVTDAKWDPNKIAGTYVIENGVIKITLTDEYLQYVTRDGGDGSLEGSLEFSGNLSRSNTDDGDQSFTMAGETVIVDFPDKYAKLSGKNATVQNDGTVLWSVTIQNDKQVDLDGYVLTDAMLAGASKVTFNPANAGTHSGDKITLASSTAQWVTITYTTPVTPELIEAGAQKNTATLQKGDDEKSKTEKESTANFTKKPLTVNKSGKADYTETSGTYGGKINWTVTVKNEYGLSLDEYIVQDPMLPKAVTGSVTVSPNGSLTLKEGTTDQYILDTTSTEVTITYQTEATIGNNSNTATAYYPNGKAPGTGGNSEDENINYPEEKALYNVTKSSVVGTDGRIKWTLSVYNQYYQDMEGFTLTDKMLASATGVTINPSNAANFSDANDSIMFTTDSKATQWIYITYYTPITDDQLQNTDGSRDNKVSLKDENNNELDTDEDTAQFNQSTSFSVTKSAAPDYESGTYGNKMNWTVRINSNYGTSLDGYLISDPMLPKGATVSNGTLTEQSDGKWMLSGTNGAKSITITYQTMATGGETYNNTAELFYPNPDDDTADTTTGAKDDESKYYKKDSELVGVSKSGNYEQDKNQITWNVQVNVQGSMSLVGYTMTDEMFPTDIGSITFNPTAAGTGATLDGNTLTLGNPDYKGSFSLSYTTLVDVNNTTNGTVISNTIGIGHGGNEVASDGGEATVTIRNTLEKHLSNGTIHYATNNGVLTKTAWWEANLVLDGSFVNQIYEDTLEVTSGDGAHTITDTQLANLEVYGKTQQYGGETLLVLGTHYTVKRTASGFRITFMNPVDTAGYKYIRISYETTMTANAPTDSNYEKLNYTYNNSAEFNGNKDSDNTYTIQRTNPEEYTTLNLTINKNWNAGPQKPTSVTTKVLYKTTQNNQTSEWRYLHVADGKVLYYGDAGYDTASDYVVTLNEEGSWTHVLNGLNKTVVKAGADGNPLPTVSYAYKIEEIAPDGSVIKNGIYKTQGGFYEVSYSSYNESGITWDGGSLDVTNQYRANTSVTPMKNWAGDAGTGSGFDSVTVQLMFHANGGTYPVRIANNEYVFDVTGESTADIVTQEITKNSEDQWSGIAWENLPTVIVVDDKAVTCTYSIRETAVTQTPTAEGETGRVIPVENNKYIVSDGYYNVTNSNSGSGNLTVTNSFEKTTTYTVAAVKNWAGDENNVSSRPAVILVQLQKSENYGNWVNQDDPVEISADSNWAYTFSGLPNQIVAEDGTITTYRYRISEVGYKMTADGDVQMLPNEAASFATDGDGVYTISYANRILDNSGTTRVTNTFTPITTIDISPQKKWVGDGNFESERPETVTFTLQQKIGYGGAWAPMKDEDGNVITVTLQNDGSTTFDKDYNNVVTATYWNGTELSDLPGEVIVLNADGSYKKDTCYYRFVETSFKPANGTETSIDVSKSMFKTENGKYDITFTETSMTGTLTVTNTYEQSIGIDKHIIDKNGVHLSAIEKEQLAGFKKTIDGKEYYVFNWLIEFDSSKDSLIRPIMDVLPEGFTLCTDESRQGQGIGGWGDSSYTYLTPLKPEHYNGYYAHPTMIFVGSGANGARPTNNLNEIWSDKWNNGDWYYYDTATNSVAFNKPAITNAETIFYIGYSTKILVADLDKLVADQTYTVQNNAIKYEKDGTPTDETAVATLKIINPIDTNLISKSYSETKIPGNVQFTLNINPEGKNLSKGDTIDIQDLFETVSYYDHDFAGGELTTGKKLVDVLMNNIKLYRVDANDNRIELNSSEYTLMFQSGSEVADGAALMKLTIPDETRIVVEYTYKLIANEATPSVIHGCKSSTRVNGRYVTMEPGLVPPAGDKIIFSNTASLISDSAQASDSVANKEYEVFKSSGTITTNALPSIKKVNTGDYSIDNLSASFLLGRYENGRWYYVSEFEEITAGKGEYELTWGVVGSDGTRISSDAKTIEIINGSDFKVALEENTLYKLIEIVVPKGYEGSNLNLSDTQFAEMIRAYLNDGATVYGGKDYSIFLNHYISTHYFTYNSVVGSYPNGVNAADVIQVKSGSDVEIPNNKLIDIGVEKEWINPITDVTDSQITVELYWSYTKDSNGIPSDAVLAKAEDLGILDANFTATKTITVGDAANDKLWKELPNGSDRRPIYYYVKETAYTIGGITYTLDTETNSYKSANDALGAYLPTYTGNAANDHTVINVKNSHQLLLKKEWKNASNIPMKNLPVNGVIVSIYGIDQDGAQTNEPLFEGILLNVDNNWTANLTNLLGDIDLSDYKAFVAVENESPDLAGYVVSCVFNLNEDTGEIIVTNKNTQATDASVTVNKLWSDGASMHTGESITATLYQSQNEIKDLSFLSSATLTASGAVIMSKIDENDTQSYVVDLNADNDWTYTWTGLPLEDENQNKYYYYVLETMTNIADASKYEVTYVVTDKTPTRTEYTIKNYRNAILVEKQWLAEDGTALTPDELTALGIDSITLDVLKKVTMVPEDGLKIAALGDSITEGKLQDGSSWITVETPYPSKLTSLLTTNGYTLIKSTNDWTSQNGVYNAGTSGQVISEIQNRVSYIDTDTDIVLVIAGTNDIHKAGDGRLSADVCGTRFTSLVESVRTRLEANPNAVIFVGSIPYFYFQNADGTTTTGYSYWDNGTLVSNFGTDVAEQQNGVNACIDEYNKKIKEYAEATDGVYYVDTCAAVHSKAIGDGCHPSRAGYDAIAQAFYTEINALYNQTNTVTTVTLTATNNWQAAVDIDDTDPNAKYYVNESDLPAGWTVKYTNNEQSVGSSIPITVTNTKYTPETSLSVEKIWVNDTADTSARDNISLALLRSVDNITWEEVEVTFPTPDKTGNDGAGNDMWTYSFTELPAEDALGRQYFYKVEEDPLPGYTVNYLNASIEAVDGGSAGSLRLSNTRAISLNLEKIWSDIDTNTHTGDPVTIRIYRTTTPGILNFEGVNLILQVPTAAVVGVDKTTEIFANKPLTEVTVAENSKELVEVTLNGSKITVKGLKDGTATIYASDGTDTIPITVTVSALEIFLNDSTIFELTAGTTGTLSAKVGGNPTTDIRFESNSSLVNISGNQITAVNVGENIPITATATLSDGSEVSATVLLNVVLPATFNITGASEVEIGKTTTLAVDKNFGTFTWSSSDTSKATVDAATGVVTGVAEGSVTITATRSDGATATHTLTVKNGDIFQSDNVVVRVPVGESVTITSATQMSYIWWHEESIVDSDLANNVITLIGVSAGEKEITVTSTGNVSATFTVIVYDKFAVTPTTKTLAYGGSVTLTPNTTDAVEYTITSGSNLISMSGNTVTANSGTEGTATITAKNTVTNETATVTITVVERITTISGTIGDYPYVYDPSTGIITITLNELDNHGYTLDSIKNEANLKNLVPIRYELTTSTGQSANLKASNLGVDWGTFDFNQLVGIIETESNTKAFTDLGQLYLWTASGTKPTSLKIYVDTTSSVSVASALPSLNTTHKSTNTAAPAAIANDWASGYIEVVLQNTSAGGLSTTIENLDAYDPNGQLYYYYVEEVSTHNGYEPSYSYDDGDAGSSYWINANEPNANGEFNIKVRNVKVESPGVELPSTGGSGTAKYYGIGIAVMFGSAAAYFILNRRRKSAS